MPKAGGIFCLLRDYYLPRKIPRTGTGSHSFRGKIKFRKSVVYIKSFQATLGLHLHIAMAYHQHGEER